jgi:hypothetical protein
MSDRMRWGSDWDNDGWGGGCAPCPPAPCPPPATSCPVQPCPPVACPPCPPPWYGPPRPPWYPGASGGVSFGTTAPQFPIRGHFWWDGALLHMWDGVEWETIGPTAPGAGGGVPEAPLDGQTYGRQNATWVPVSTGKTTIVFGMTCTTNRTLPGSSAWGIVPFNDTPNPDTLSAWDSVQHKYTPTVPGVYQFQIRGGGSPTGGIALLKNDPGTFNNALGSDIIIAIQSQATTGWNSVLGGVDMNGTTDFVRFWAWGSDAIFHNTGSNQIFTGVKLP